MARVASGELVGQVAVDSGKDEPQTEEVKGGSVEELDKNMDSLVEELGKTRKG